ncbi:MAG: NfeD family protein [Saprospiraceae bacterium]|nr:NfeD family protein [Saprospiraceae bacterium]
MEFIENSEPLLRVLWYIALPISLIFVIQSILTFMGVDHDHDASWDSPMDLFTFRNLINFLLGFSWAGISFYETIENKTLLICVATLVGAGFVYMFFLIISQFIKLEEDNTFNIYDTLNQTATVYLRIPGSRTGKGKVQISVKGSVHEIDAVTEGDTLETGASARVTYVESTGLVVVEKN